MTVFRNATLDELEQILDWAAEEGWNPGHDDATAFFAADPDGFFVAVDANGAPVAAISVVNHTAEFAFLGLYIVRPEYRAQGIGFQLWTHALQHAADRVVGLDGVDAQQENYRASGFSWVGGTTRFTGAIKGQHDPDIQSVGADAITTLIRMEAAAAGVEKPQYMHAWFSNTETRHTITAVENGDILGFCTVRSCWSGAKIGPLVAPDTAVAKRLMHHAAALFDGPFTLDVPETATGLQSLCDALGMTPGFKTARMYRGFFPVRNRPIYAVGSLELG